MSASDASGPFTRDQLWRGALHAWVAFMVLMTLAWTIAAIVTDVINPTGSAIGAVAILPTILIFSTFIGGGVSLVVALAGIPLAALLGRLLRGVRAPRVHILVFAGFGGAIGALPPLFLILGRSTSLVELLAVVSVTICAASTAYGRWRADRPPRQRIDRDAIAEDATLDRGR